MSQVPAEVVLEEGDPGTMDDAQSGDPVTMDMDMDQSGDPGASGPPARTPKPQLEAGPGANSRLVDGKRANSKLIVKDGHTYLIDKTEVKTGEVTYYLKCKSQACIARALIKNGIFKSKPEGEDRHTCGVTEASNHDQISKQEAMNRMRRRAAREASSYSVSRS